MKKVYYSNSVPAGVVLVVANDEEEGTELVKAELARLGLPVTTFTLHRVSRAEVGVTVLVRDNASAAC